jgi:hypothetical protein
LLLLLLVSLVLSSSSSSSSGRTHFNTFKVYLTRITLNNKRFFYGRNRTRKFYPTQCLHPSTLLGQLRCSDDDKSNATLCELWGTSTVIVTDLIQFDPVRRNTSEENKIQLWFTTCAYVVGLCSFTLTQLRIHRGRGGGEFLTVRLLASKSTYCFNPLNSSSLFTCHQA